MKFRRSTSRTVFAATAIAVAIPGLSGCGFTPLYADKDNSLQTYLTNIEVKPITEPDRASYALASELEATLSGSGAAQYELLVDLKEGRRSTVVTSSAQTARFEYVLEANYILTDRKTGTRYQNDKSIVTSYGIVASQYSSLVGEEEAIRKTAVRLADKIELDLVLYFKGQIDGKILAPGEEPTRPNDEESLKERQLDRILGEDFDQR